MNEINIAEWFIYSWSNKPVLTIWFALLCLSAGLLFINIIYALMILTFGFCVFLSSKNSKQMEIL